MREEKLQIYTKWGAGVSKEYKGTKKEAFLNYYVQFSCFI